MLFLHSRQTMALAIRRVCGLRNSGGEEGIGSGDGHSVLNSDDIRIDIRHPQDLLIGFPFITANHFLKTDMEGDRDQRRLTAANMARSRFPLIRLHWDGTVANWRPLSEIDDSW